MKWTFKEFDEADEIDIERLIYYLNTEENNSKDGKD